MKRMIKKSIALQIILILIISSLSFAMGAVNSEDAEATSGSSRGSRGTMDESLVGDFGNTRGSAETITRSESWTLRGTLSGNNDRDWVEINLLANPGSSTVDNISVHCNYNNAYSWQPIVMVIYGEYNYDYDAVDDDLIILATAEFDSWTTPPEPYAFAYATGTYYVKFFLPYSYSYQFDYEFVVSVSSVTPPDYNNIIDTAHETGAPPTLNNLSVDMNRDMFDWFMLESPPIEDPINTYGINFSFQFEIIEGSAVKKADTNPPIEFYTVAIILIFHEDAPDGGVYLQDVIKCSQQNKFGMNRSLDYWTNIQAYRTYIGIYVQVIGRSDTGGEPGYELGQDYMEGHIKYKIKRLHAVEIFPPKLTGIKVTKPAGNTYEIYTYNATYYDKNNDPPTNIYIKIDDFPSAKMVRKDKTDKNFIDGMEYVYSVDGTYLGESSYHFYRIYAKDKENDALGDNGLKHLGPIVSNNVPPYIKDSASQEIMLYEDCCARYVDLTTVFEDSDNDTLLYSVWNEDEEVWSKLGYQTENLDVDLIRENGTLKLSPKLNKYNRMEITDTGSDKVLVNATDTEDPKKAENELFYVEDPWELDVIILSVNDPPEVNKPFTMFFPGDALEIEEDSYNDELNLSEVFHDPVENDPLTFKVSGNHHFNVDFNPNGTINITPIENFTGSEVLTFTASDYQDSVSDTLRIKIEGTNDAPILNHTPKQVAYEDQWYNYTFTAFDYADNDELTFYTDISKKLGLSKDAYNFNEETGELLFKANNDMVGTYDDILVSVTDPLGLTDSEYVTFVIVNTPDPPVPKIIEPRNGSRFLTRTKIDFDGQVDDPDLLIPEVAEVIRYSWYSGDDLLGTSEDLKNTILGEGFHEIIFEVSDGVFTRNTSIVIEVLAYNTDDTDEDGMYDYWEFFHELGFKDPRDAEEDPDGDGFTNLEEFLGPDGSPLGDDDTDPWDPESHPTRQATGLVSEESDGVLGQGTTFDWIIFGIATIVVLILVIFMIISSTDKRRRKRLQLKKRRMMKHRMAMMRGGIDIEELEVISGPEPQKINCHKCGEKTTIGSNKRPVVVTCPKCETKGVVYE